VVERLADGRFRATCALLPDGEALAATEVAARRAMEAAIEEFLRERARNESRKT
jgi:hypothetical protein